MPILSRVLSMLGFLAVVLGIVALLPGQGGLAWERTVGYVVVAAALFWGAARAARR